MATKARRKATKGNEYWIRGVRGRKSITARNVQDAVNKANRLYPKAELLGVERKQSRSGREYETYWINR